MKQRVPTAPDGTASSRLPTLDGRLGTLYAFPYLLSVADKEGLPPLRGLPDEALEPPKTLGMSKARQVAAVHFTKYAHIMSVASTSLLFCRFIPASFGAEERTGVKVGLDIGREKIASAAVCVNFCGGSIIVLVFCPRGLSNPAARHSLC